MIIRKEHMIKTKNILGTKPQKTNLGFCNIARPECRLVWRCPTRNLTGFDFEFQLFLTLGYFTSTWQLAGHFRGSAVSNSQLKDLKIKNNRDK